MFPNTIQILLATYNGEKFLTEQLQSLFSQTYHDWSLLIRDDHSTDGTITIIEQFKAAHPDKVRVLYDHQDSRENDNLGGPIQNFNRLLEQSCAPYVMFCDQDDVWDPRKIAMSMDKMQEMEGVYGAHIPLLVHTDFALSDADNNIRVASQNQSHKMQKERTDIGRLIAGNVITGMSMLMNRPLVEKSLPLPPGILMHDWWIGLVAAALGRIGYVDVPLVNYRQHGNNTLGMQIDITPRRLSVKQWLRKKHKKYKKIIMKRIGKEKPNSHRQGLLAMAQALRARYGAQMQSKDVEIVDAFIARLTRRYTFYLLRKRYGS